jgi:hypothetical protein
MLVERHGPAVLSVCCRVLRDEQDAEDPDVRSQKWHSDTVCEIQRLLKNSASALVCPPKSGRTTPSG